MFNSQYECKLDPKGRLVLPSKIKGAIPEANGTTLMLRMAEDKCLALYPMVEFKKLENQIKALSINNPEQRKLQRTFFITSVEVELDSAGRLLIPKLYQTYAGLEKDVVVVGMGSRIEIWNPQNYLNNIIEDPADLSSLMEKYLS
ncbi:MAG TPA: division/cell wall cluster transcriptional repressor MraZ [Algoriphagus sp.]|jgi:MraZ protein|uniref:division/cell wall cluster transcriptional repressor MraZ n=1 Tax=unclassified Algoriphagus TaxID=2641541 RepID=UPI000C43CEB2|nr:MULTISPECIES: division/cell wall cluster transcriptional repressor MraZ [unclassified Algoriphagus]MAL14419.1 division/cell wall cluster transcriptional repressor MraZ [Algoriphagus sp.]MAN87228.1 division/cell wall cluster transcriptional repressor MraZ [Algoriphagus sp.]HAD50324.1 division/cell wall cluster transcriptional repressor MraZ [Algoriphagus sp.]HAH36677.1 division/cell wall cluster transcriptional repressor MraZ [Algoriphagus sp.]HAS58318.1 division/cell wall cluster transcript|tara:strand:+ start:811 stop:1245 length:435 start_codon:yes stop_codon:yes gene_type:complete